MKQQNHSESEDNFKVAPIISDMKWELLRRRILSTVTGLATIGHYEFTDEGARPTIIGVSVLVYLLVPALIVIPASVIQDWKLHALAVLIPGVLAPLATLLADLATGSRLKLHKYLVAAVYAYMWSVHFCIGRRLYDQDVFTAGSYAAFLVLSIATVLTSSSTICHAPVRQFSASTLDYESPGVHSTLYCRFYIALPLLATELGMLYSPGLPDWLHVLRYLTFVAALAFVVWMLGWLSSLYNTAMFLGQNLLNCLAFGEENLHSGGSFRGRAASRACMAALGLNVLAIGLNVALLRSMEGWAPLPQIVQGQHIFLLFFAFGTSAIVALSTYFTYTCSASGRQNIRLDTGNNVHKQGGQCWGAFSISSKQLINTLMILLIPVVVTLLAVFAFARHFSGWGDGRGPTPPPDPLGSKTVTWILLAVDGAIYLVYVVVRECTRARAKIGIKLSSPGTFSRSCESLRQMCFKLALKVSGALGIMGLVLRIKDVNEVSGYIMALTPMNPRANPYAFAFITYVLVPVLIYRSYKRSQNFSHFFHLSMIVSFILILANDTRYFYESLFVVLAFPNFPHNPFRLLFVSPFTTPAKLLHKSETLYRLGYLLANTTACLLYLASLGTLQFTMVLGLPIYWVVVPSVNCQSALAGSGSSSAPDSRIHDAEQQQQSQVGLQAQNRSTPEHNLYDKITSQLPFGLFRDLQPGYYLLRISKYILLVEVAHQLYGTCQLINVVGLQAQEVTTCHAKEGETIDRIVEHTWSQNPDNLQCWAFHDAVATVIHEECAEQVSITAENEIQLTGVVESEDFYQLFKRALIRGLVFYYSKMLEQQPQKQLSLNQVKQARAMLEDLLDRTTKDKIDQYFPYEFIKKNNIDLAVGLNAYRAGKPKKKLPPLSKQTTKAKDSLFDDFADLIGGASNSNSLVQVVPQPKPKQEPRESLLAGKDQQSIIISEKNDQADLNLAVIVSAYLAVLGKINYLNLEKLFKHLKRDSTVLGQFQLDAGTDLVANAVGCAFKLAVAKQLQGQTEVEHSDFEAYDKDEFLGTLESAGFSEAVRRAKSDIWTAAYNQSKKQLSIKRLARNDTALYMFSVETAAVQAVWNNLRFELLYATNDNDERYSIQTHQYLLRNLLVEACEEPYGYAGFYSQEYLNL